MNKRLQKLIDNQGGGYCPTIGTTDLGMPKIVEMNENIKTDVVAIIDNEGWNESTRRVYGTTGLAPTLNTCNGGHHEAKIAEPLVGWSRDNKGNVVDRHPVGVANTITKLRIRKLTPRECFRLMGCDEPTIDKLLNSGISNSQLYKLAGNSIVVDVLYNIFRKLFVEQENESRQMTLF